MAMGLACVGVGYAGVRAACQGGAGSVLLLPGSSGFFWVLAGDLLVFDNTEEARRTPEEHRRTSEEEEYRRRNHLHVHFTAVVQSETTNDFISYRSLMIYE
jgi:hypothetical protein